MTQEPGHSPILSKPLLLSLLVSVLSVLSINTTLATEPSPGRRVMTWVPPYAVADCEKRLNESFDGVGLKDGITHLSLQFWNPTKNGGLQFVTRFGLKGEATVPKFRKWGTKHGVRVMLCVYNAKSSGWDWNLARFAFETNRTKFVKALVDETLRLKLDGIDIDFEGKEERDGSQAPFIRFVAELSSRLHAAGKELSVDSFAYKWNAPNQTWWPELLPHVDGLIVMGYSETGAGAERWRSYDFVKSAAGNHASKILLGMPGHKGKWQNSSVTKHLQWVLNEDSVGVAIWDARLRDSAWRTKATWETIKRIKTGTKPGSKSEE